MKLNDIESKRLLPVFSREQADWICNALDVFVKAVDGRLSALSSPFTPEAIHALTDEELQLWFEQFKLAKYYPDLPREYRDRILYDEIRLFNMLGTKPAVEALCRYIFADFETTVSIIDNLAFDDTGTLVDASAKDLYDAIVNVPDSSFGDDETQIRRIFENLKKFGRASQKLRTLILQSDSDVEMPLLAVDSHGPTSVCDDETVDPVIKVTSIHLQTKDTVIHSYNYKLNTYTNSEGTVESENDFYSKFVTTSIPCGIIRGSLKIHKMHTGYNVSYSGNDSKVIIVKSIRKFSDFTLAEAYAMWSYSETFDDKILRYTDGSMFFDTENRLELANAELRSGSWSIVQGSESVVDIIKDAYNDTRYMYNNIRENRYGVLGDDEWKTVQSIHDEGRTLNRCTAVDIWKSSTAHKCALSYQASNDEPDIPGYYWIGDDGSGYPVEQWFSRQELESAGYTLTEPTDLTIEVYFTNLGASGEDAHYSNASSTRNLYDADGNLIPYDSSKTYTVLGVWYKDGTEQTYGTIEIWNENGNLGFRVNGFKVMYSATISIS